MADVENSTTAKTGIDLRGGCEGRGGHISRPIGVPVNSSSPLSPHQFKPYLLLLQHTFSIILIDFHACIWQYHLFPRQWSQFLLLAVLCRQLTLILSLNNAVQFIKQVSLGGVTYVWLVPSACWHAEEVTDQRECQPAGAQARDHTATYGAACFKSSGTLPEGRVRSEWCSKALRLLGEVEGITDLERAGDTA